RFPFRRSILRIMDVPRARSGRTIITTIAQDLAEAGKPAKSIPVIPVAVLRDQEFPGNAVGAGPGPGEPLGGGCTALGVSDFFPADTAPAAGRPGGIAG